MDIAKLSITLSTEEARRQSQQLSKDLANVGTVTDKSTKQAQDSLNKLSGGIAISAQQVSQMSAAVQKLNPQLAQLAAQASQAAAAVGGGAGGVGGGGGAGAGGGGGGMPGAAGAASTAFTNLASSILRMVTAYLSIRAAVRATEALIEARIQMDRLVFGLIAVTGSSERAREEMAFFSREVERLGLNFEETIKDFVKIEAAFTQSGFTAKQAEKVFIDVATVTKALGLSSATTGRILYDFQEMASLGTVQLRQLRMVIMQVPGGLEIASRALGVTTAEFHKLLHDGLIPASEFIPKFTAELSKTFGANIGPALENLESQVNKLKTAWFKLKAELGDAEVFKTATKSLTSLVEMARFAVAGLTKNQTQFTQAAIVDPLVSMLKKAGGEIGAAVLPAAQRLPTEAQIEGMEKLRKLNEQVQAEMMEGYEHERTQIELTAKKRIDEVRKVLAIIDAEKDPTLVKQFFEQGDPVANILKARDESLARFDMKRQAENAKELTASYLKAQDALERLTIEGMEPAEAAAARINDQFRKQTYILIDLEEQGIDTANAYEKLTTARDRALKEIDERRNRAGFTGETVAQLRAGFRRDEAGLLTEKDAEEFQRATQRMQDRSAELARRMKGDAVTVREAWSIGWEQQVKSFGSFSERVGQAAAGLADSLDRNFTDAFTGLVTGTKKASDAFREMTQAILSDLARIAIRQLIVAPALQGLSSAFGSLGSTSAATAGAGAGASAGFANVGGAASSPGLGFAAELRGALARTSQVGQKPSVNITMINASNPKEIDDHLAANPGAILNPISRNASTVRRMLA